jgi:hypothetical protein
MCRVVVAMGFLAALIRSIFPLLVPIDPKCQVYLTTSLSTRSNIACQTHPIIAASVRTAPSLYVLRLAVVYHPALRVMAPIQGLCSAPGEAPRGGASRYVGRRLSDDCLTGVAYQTTNPSSPVAPNDARVASHSFQSTRFCSVARSLFRTPSLRRTRRPKERTLC